MKKHLILILFISSMIFEIQSISNDKKSLEEYIKIDLFYSKNLIGNKNYYLAPLKVGTPEQTFNVQIDTSVSTSWLPSVKCSNCHGAKNLYEEKKSSTSLNFNKEIELEDEDGKVEGFAVCDTINFGGKSLPNFKFVQVTEIDDDFRDHYEGKLGLGYRGEIGNDFNLLEKLKFDGLIAQKIFTISESNENQGELIIGKPPSSKYSFCNITSGEDLDEIYKESWVCELTHIGLFKINEGIKNSLDNYTIISDGKVNFDSAYDFIAVPITDRQIIEDLLELGNLDCKTTEKDLEHINKDKLINKFNEEEISIKCKVTINQLVKKNIAISFVLQGYTYSIPLDSLFVLTEDEEEMEMLVKYINDKDAIWTFGYPFMKQFKLIFNMEENHVGIMKHERTALPIVNIDKEWNVWYDTYYNFFYKKIDLTAIIIVATVLGTLLLLIVVFLVIRAIKRKKAKQSNLFKDEYDSNKVY